MEKIAIIRKVSRSRSRILFRYFGKDLWENTVSAKRLLSAAGWGRWEQPESGPRSMKALSTDEIFLAVL